MRLGTVCLFLVLTVLIVMAAFSVALRAAAEELTKRDPEVVAEVIGYMREGGPPRLRWDRRCDRRIAS